MRDAIIMTNLEEDKVTLTNLKCLMSESWNNSPPPCPPPSSTSSSGSCSPSPGPEPPPEEKFKEDEDSLKAPLAELENSDVEDFAQNQVENIGIEDTRSIILNSTCPENMRERESMQGDHTNSNNNSECPLQCNGMVSECCWNGDCVEARTTKSNLKPAIKLNSDKSRAGETKRRVTFNESLNTFFDADYVILVGEDCNGDETTRLVSMCKKSNCQPGPGGTFDLNFSPFEPPLEYVDQVTLSPPEGYKDVLGATRPDDESESESSGENRSEDEDGGGLSPVCEQCSSCSACASQQQRYIVETITLTTVTERRIVREADEPRLSGILKGGKLWKNCENDLSRCGGTNEDKGELVSRRSVRFSEDDTDKKEIQDIKEENKMIEVQTLKDNENHDKLLKKENGSGGENEKQDELNAEVTLTFRLGTSVLLSDKLPANSAVRQLFPDCEAQQRLLGVITNGEAETKDNVDSSSLLSPGQSVTYNSDDESSSRTSTQIRRTIERNALRRSLLRCSEPIRRKSQSKNEDNSLVERIRQLTCDVEDDKTEDKNLNSPVQNQPSTYKKLTELFSRRERCHSESSARTDLSTIDNSCCWLMIDPVRAPNDFTRSSSSLIPHTISPTTSRPFNNDLIGGENIYSLDDINEALGECGCPPNGKSQPPDLVATAQEKQRNETSDELALFVQRDMGRIERLKKRYSLTDDDQDDYGFSRRPSVRGIKPRFGSTTEIIQQIQVQLQPPALSCPTRTGSHMTWPYATEQQQQHQQQQQNPSPSETTVNRRNARGLPILPEDPYYASPDYRYLDYGGSGSPTSNNYMYSSTGNLYARNELVPYNPRVAQQQQDAQIYGRRPVTGPVPVHYSNGTLPQATYIARARVPQVNYTTQARSDSPQRIIYPQRPNNYPPNVANGRYYPPPPVQNNYNYSPGAGDQHSISPAGSPTRVINKQERGTPEGANTLSTYSNDNAAVANSVYYAMNV